MTIDEGERIQLLSDLACAVGYGDAVYEIDRIDAGPTGANHVRIKQSWHGYELKGGEVVAHMRNGSYAPMFSGYFPSVVIDTPAISISESEAGQIAASVVDIASPQVHGIETAYVVLDRNPVERIRLCRIVTVDAGDDFDESFDAFVDAATGAVLRVSGNQNLAINRTVWNAHKTVRQMYYTLDRIEGGPPAADKSVNSAYRNAGTAHDFFYEVLNHSGFANSPNEPSYLEINVNYATGANSNNAEYRDGPKIVLGSGDGVKFGNFAESRDIMTHEYAHGVIDHTSRIGDWGEPGTMNEAFADVMAIACGIWCGDSWIYNSTSWYFGEDVATPLIPGDAMRYINNPSRGVTDLGNNEIIVNPDHYSERYIGDQDGEGIHINSGIVSLIYFLLSDGGYHPQLKNEVWVNQLGPEVSAKIFYYAFCHLLTWSAEFEDAATALVHAAYDYEGYRGLCSAYTAGYVVGIFEHLMGGESTVGFELTYTGNVYFYGDGHLWAPQFQGYAYKWDENPDVGSAVFWIYSRSKYVWTSAEYYPDYFDYSNNTWKTAINGVIE
jgi:vibriolysin